MQFLVKSHPDSVTDLILYYRAKARGIVVEVVHNTSVMGAVASCGLQLYQFGYTVSVPLFEGVFSYTQYSILNNGVMRHIRYDSYSCLVHFHTDTVNIRDNVYMCTI